MRSHPVRLVVWVVVVAVTIVAWWLLPIVGAAMTLGIGAAIGFLVLPEVIRTTVRGPGYQYREPPRDKPH